MGNSKSKSNVSKYRFNINKQCGVFYFKSDILINQLMTTKGYEHVDMFITVLCKLEEINLSIRNVEDIKNICKIYNHCDKMVLNVTINETESIYDCMIYYNEPDKLGRDRSHDTRINSHGHIYYGPLF